jgi:hypothetical protein
VAFVDTIRPSNDAGPIVNDSKSDRLIVAPQRDSDFSSVRMLEAIRQTLLRHPVERRFEFPWQSSEFLIPVGANVHSNSDI